MKDKKSLEYLSLQEATKYCHYSQEYLSLRARQGKLKAMKFGRNWVTKKEWLEEYLSKIGDYNNLRVKEAIGPPKNLPIEARRYFDISKCREIISHLRGGPIRFAYLAALAFILLSAGVVFGKDSFKSVCQDLDPYIEKIGQAGDVAVGEIGKSFQESFAILAGGFAEMGSGISRITENVELTAISAQEISQETIETFKDFGNWLFSSLTRQTFALGQKIQKGPQKIIRGYITANDFVEEKISQGYKAITQLWRVPEKVEEKLTPKSAGEGLVVIPSTEKDEEIKKKIKESFSDEVKVEPVDKTSGIITPVFKEREGERYLYILVPIQEKN